MLAVLMNSKEVRENYDISFSFRHSDQYLEGYEKRVNAQIPIYSFSFFELSDHSILPSWIPLLIRRILLKIARNIVYGPLFIYEVIVLLYLFQKIQPDILHINNGGYPAALSARAAAIAGKLASVKSIIMVVNNLAEGYTSPFRMIDYPLDQLVIKSVNLFITGSTAASNHLKSVLKLPDEQSISIHNGIPNRLATENIIETKKRLGLSEFQGTLFGVVALLVPRKGHQVLFNAILKLRDRSSEEIQNFKVLIEGHGPLKRDLLAFVDKYELHDHIEFVGDENNIIDFLNILDVVILPSIEYEDFPNVILEAMSLGKPVISTRLAGIPEQVENGRTGLLVNPCSSGELETAILTLSQNPSLRSKMGVAASNRFERTFTDKVAIENYINLYGAISGEKDS